MSPASTSHRPDVILRGGTVVDGTGAPGEERDLVLVDGRVSGDAQPGADAIELDASGCTVAPGFIDIHTHYDAQVFWDPDLTPSCYHGVTTVVAGNCGFSLAPTRPEGRESVARTLENVEDMSYATLAAGVPWDFESFGEYLDSVRRRGTALNWAAYVGHTPLRLYVMGHAAYERVATPEEVVQMQTVLAESLRAGAAGFATSFAPTHRGMNGLPIPSRVGEREEFLALLATVAEWGRGVVGVTAGEGWTVDDLYDLQPSVGVPFTYGALLSQPSGEHLRRLALHAERTAAGSDVWPQVSPRPLTFAFRMDDPFPLNPTDLFADLMGRDLAARRAAYADPTWQARAEGETDAMTVARPRWETWIIDSSECHPDLVGMRLADLAEREGAPPLTALLRLAAEDPGMWVRAIVMNDDETEVAKLLTAERCALGLSDAGAHVGQLCDAPQATDFLGRWVRDKQLMPIEEAVRRLTSAQADLFGFANRGRLVPGAAADVVVFDAETVAAGPITRRRDFPANGERLTAASPEGVRHVLVNGTPIRQDGEQLDVSANRPGTIVRPHGPQPQR